jgi:small nuclear ribonucleoprotein (snRNP)-like protein
MTLSNDQKQQFEKDLNNSERFILEKLSGDRKASYRKFEKVNSDVAEVLKETRLISATLETYVLSENVKADNVEKKIEKIEKNKLVKLGYMDKLLVIMAFIILVAFWQQVNAVITHFASKQGIEVYENNAQYIKLRGETIEIDSINIK